MLRYGSARPLLLGRGTMLPRLAARALATAPQVATEEECAAYYDTASHYDVLWGKDNIHIGYYPHLVDRTAVELSFQQAAGLIVNRMVALGDISHTSRVLDLGCGKGHACELIAKLTGAACTGLDLSPGNIERATALAASRPELSLDFVEGSFTSLPEQLRQGQFTHVISQEAFSHAHAEIHTIFDELKTTLSDEGLAIINDYLGNDVPVSEETQLNVHDRLGFGVLLGHTDWRHAAEDSGFDILHYENLNEHMAHGYSQLAASADQHPEFKLPDGRPLADGYRYSEKAARQREIGLNLCMMSVIG